MTAYNHLTVREPRLIKKAGLNTHLCYIMEGNRRKKPSYFRFLLFFLTNTSITGGLQIRWKG